MWHEIEQNDSEWFELRLGKVTGSVVASVMANSIKSGVFNPKAPWGLPAKKLALKLALERMTNLRNTNSYKNSYMGAGHEFEPVAIEAYEERKMLEVTKGGFFSNGWTGDSPDGLVGENGVIEVKSVIPSVQFERLEKGGIDSAYKWQLQNHLWLSGRSWCEYVSYCYAPEFIDSKRLYIHRVYRNEEMISQMVKRVNEFQKFILNRIEILQQ